MKKLLFILLLSVYGFAGNTQGVELYHKAALKANQDKLYRNLVQNTINKNLSKELKDSTEDNWQDAFQAMEVLQYKTKWIDSKINAAGEYLTSGTLSFQRAFLELIYTHYPAKKFRQPVQQLFIQVTDAKIFAMCAVYLLKSDSTKENINFIAVKTKMRLQEEPANPILLELQQYIAGFNQPVNSPDISPFFQKNYLTGNVLLISLQRKNRDYPGLVMVRDAAGNFIIDSSGNYFAVPQLARSVGNLPPFLTNGNTPQGIMRMDKFDVSVSSFIGPTPNLQLSLPFEKKAFHFFQSQDETDTLWDIERYKKLLPEKLRTYAPLQQTWYAGMAGRTEIIAHGSTVNPRYYLHQPFYPLTPTQGCLATTELWSAENGKRITSDQQKLVSAVLKAGGANGYAIVIEINDEQKPVSFDDILPFINGSSQK